MAVIEIVHLCVRHLSLHNKLWIPHCEQYLIKSLNPVPSPKSYFGSMEKETANQQHVILSFIYTESKQYYFLGSNTAQM